MYKKNIVKVGNILIGGSNPVVIQSMTDTYTADVTKTVRQILELHKAGSEIIRITVNDEQAAKAVPTVVQELIKHNCHVPLVGDFHYNGHILLSKYPECAQALAKYRINPGNVGFGQKKDIQFAEIIKIAIANNKPVRIGVNWGSLEQTLLAKLIDQNNSLKNPASLKEVMHEAIITSALESAKYAQDLGLAKDKIIISAKVSEVQNLILIYQALAQKCDYALHLGLTEAGMGTKGIVSSAVSLGILLQQGIGNTIRVSLTPAPNAPRIEEVKVCREILQSLGLRYFTPSVISCPGCGRTTSSFFRELTSQVKNHLDEKMHQWKEKYSGVENMKVAVMGCIVNGPGESKNADIGISLPGSGESPIAPVFIKGSKAYTLRGDDICGKFIKIVEEYVKNKYGKVHEQKNC